MKALINLEELIKLLLSYLLSLYVGYSWWLYLALLLVPDIGMLGYLINTKVGAWTYNVFHHQGIALVVGATGFASGVLELQMAGLILLGHSSMDRALGYGLKHTDSFKHTHLGWIGTSSEDR